MTYLKWLLLVLLVSGVVVALGSNMALVVENAGAAEPTMPVGGWCKVEAVNYDVLMRATDCQTWVLSCPTTAASCRWLPVERVEPE
jgi:hypothetical protein